MFVTAPTLQWETSPLKAKVRKNTERVVQSLKWKVDKDFKERIQNTKYKMCQKVVIAESKFRVRLTTMHVCDSTYVPFGYVSFPQVKISEYCTCFTMMKLSEIKIRKKVWTAVRKIKLFVPKKVTFKESTLTKAHVRHRTGIPLGNITSESKSISKLCVCWSTI